MAKTKNKNLMIILVVIGLIIMMNQSEKKEASYGPDLGVMIATYCGNFPGQIIWEGTSVAAAAKYCIEGGSGYTCQEQYPSYGYTIVAHTCAAGTCTDTDGGQVTGTKGRVYGVDDIGQPYSIWDSCLGTSVREEYCDGTVPKDIAIGCSGGMICVDGKCGTPPSCIAGWTNNPSCSGDDIVQDYLNSDCSITQDKFKQTCTNGCTNGICDGSVCAYFWYYCSGDEVLLQECDKSAVFAALCSGTCDDGGTGKTWTSAQSTSTLTNYFCDDTVTCYACEMFGGVLTGEVVSAPWPECDNNLGWYLTKPICIPSDCIDGEAYCHDGEVFQCSDNTYSKVVTCSSGLCQAPTDETVAQTYCKPGGGTIPTNTSGLECLGFIQSEKDGKCKWNPIIVFMGVFMMFAIMMKTFTGMKGR